MNIEDLLSNNSLSVDFAFYNVSDNLIQSFEALKTMDSAKFGSYLAESGDLGSEAEQLRN